MIETRRLQLRPIESDDAAFLLELFNDESFIRFIGDRGVRTLDEAGSYIVDFLDNQSATSSQLWACQLRENENVLGVCSLRKRDELAHPDIGFAFLPAYRGQGFALEATQAFLQHLLEQPDIQEVVAVAAVDNQPSIALLHRLGFEQQGHVQIASCGDQCSALFVLESGFRNRPVDAASDPRAF